MSSRAQGGTQLAAAGDGAIGIEALADAAGIHPELVRRLLGMGLIEPRGGTGTAPRFSRADAARLAQAVRLRRDLGLNYAGAVLVVELLARIDELEYRTGRGRVVAWSRAIR